ncbi:MAG TPA: hypothetical protein PKV16_05270 [Caldisericia bacterium]|nr:hypothetical protein [Caldisericia bacterium]HPF48724.1 hypothetical protein [Caldisericia bacterium]HPI83616.1 hypothetical protein [Caldisericia bacterium]HPQ93179.1 hypothetical protein [Caldisericia bacterium]HRV74988.1 hypothetical protein [Caldisericia bacterium]
MVDRIDKKAVNSLIYGISASIRKLFGGGADAVMRIAGPYVVEEFEALGVKFEGKDPQTLSDEVKKATLELGMCDDISIEDTGDHYKILVGNCSFWEATVALREKGISPFACPFANLAMTVLEKNLGQKTTVEKIEPIGDRASEILLAKV